MREASRPRILLIEDDADVALGLRDDLEMEGYSVEVVADGTAAAIRGREPEWALILLDVMLPGKDGFEICRELRRAGVSTPIIMLTARGQDLEKVTGLELGADDYVTKPYSPRELRARIKARLRTSERPGGEVYRFSDVEADFGRAELRRGGEPVEITPIELKLLKLFVDRRGRVLTRSQILDAVWGPGLYVTDRAVDAHLVNLRRKIEPLPTTPIFLVSVRGIGYRFDG